MKRYGRATTACNTRRFASTKGSCQRDAISAADVEHLRSRYRPRQIRLLFVGESAPAGGTFFYAENSTLYFETRAAFGRAFPKLLSDTAFLDLFRDLGCYLDDLCLEPVNQLADQLRRRKRTEFESSLAERLRRYRPMMVIAIGKTTAAPHVRSALGHAELADVPVVDVAFPGRPNHTIDFHREMSRVLGSATRSRIVDLTLHGRIAVAALLPRRG
jgi:hypothetical protein